MYNSEKLYNQLLTALFDLETGRRSLLNDLVLLKDYNKIMSSRLEDEGRPIEQVKGRYTGLYTHHIQAEKMKRYLEQNIIDYYAIDKWDLFVQLNNGDKFIYDSFYNIIRFDLYEGDNLTDDQELNEFRKNLKKMIDRNYITQDELANRVGVDCKTISRYVTGRTIPDCLTLNKIAKALGCSVEDFFYKRF